MPCAEPCKHLLSEAKLPPFVVGQFARRSEASVAHSARLHIALAGEIPTRADGMSAVIEAEPAFVTGEAVRRAFDFAAVRDLGQSADWRHRLTAVLKASLTDTLLTGDPGIVRRTTCSNTCPVMETAWYAGPFHASVKVPVPTLPTPVSGSPGTTRAPETGRLRNLAPGYGSAIGIRVCPV